VPTALSFLCTITPSVETLGYCRNVPNGTVMGGFSFIRSMASPWADLVNEDALPPFASEREGCQKTALPQRHFHGDLAPLEKTLWMIAHGADVLHDELQRAAMLRTVAARLQ